MSRYNCTIREFEDLFAALERERASVVMTFDEEFLEMWSYMTDADPAEFSQTVKSFVDAYGYDIIHGDLDEENVIELERKGGEV